MENSEILNDDSINQSSNDIKKPQKQQKNEEYIKKQANSKINDVKISDIDWDYIQNSLPIGQSEQEKKSRELMFKKFDLNGNGIISLAEIYKGLSDMGEKLKCIYSSKKCLLMAFNTSKSISQSKNKHGSDYVDKVEFRYFLIYIRQYFEYLMLFKKFDSSNDNQITFQEFKQSQDKLQEWGFNAKNLEEEFQKIDFDQSGSVNFNEFVDYAIKKSLGVIANNQVEAQKILMSKQTNKTNIQDQKVYEAPFQRVKSTKKQPTDENTKINDHKNQEKKINQMTYEQLEELQNELRLENMQVKEENRQIKQEIQQLNKQAQRNKF